MAGRRRYQILICDDDDNFAEMLGEYLGIACHCDVVRVASEADLWPQIEKGIFDLLLLDYHLPGTDGLEILRKITLQDVNLPTVMMTGLGSEQVAARAIQTGALDYLVKGEYSFSSLEGLIERAVQVSVLRKSMQESLKQIQYQAIILNGVRDAVVVWGIDGLITYWNPSANRLYDMGAEQIVGRTIYEVYFPRFSPAYQFPLPFDEGIYQSERWFYRGEWDRTWVSSQITILNDAEGQTIGFMDVTRDITSQKQIEEKLQLRLQTEHLLSQLSGQMISTSIVENSDYLTEALGRVTWQINAQIGLIMIRNNFRLVPIAINFEKPEDYSLDATFEVDLTRDQYPWRVSDLLKRSIISVPSLIDIPEGVALREFFLKRNFNIMIIIPMVYSENLFGLVVFGLEEWGSQWEGDYDYLLHTYGQILLRALLQKESDKALRDSEARYRAIVDKHQTEMICRFTPGYLLTFANETFCHYYQVSREDLIGTSFLRPIMESDQEQLQKVVESLSAQSPISTTTFRIQDDHQVKWQEWAVRGIVDDRQNLIEYQAVGRDITDRKQMEEQIQSAQARLAQANRLASIGQLASSVAHQLSNPLATIIGDAQLLSHALPKEHPDSESARAIINAGWRAQQVIDELMKFSDISDKAHKDVSIHDTIQKALLLSSSHIDKAGIQLGLNLPEADLEVRGNEQQLVDLWINLFLAIVSQSEARGVKTIVLHGICQDHLVVFTCSHDGVPVREEEAKTMLDPQLIPTSAKWGTGMELSICREIVRQHNGEMTVYPENDKTVYKIILREGGVI